MKHVNEGAALYTAAALCNCISTGFSSDMPQVIKLSLIYSWCAPLSWLKWMLSILIDLCLSIPPLQRPRAFRRNLCLHYRCVTQPSKGRRLIEKKRKHNMRHKSHNWRKNELGLMSPTSHQSVGSDRNIAHMGYWWKWTCSSILMDKTFTHSVPEGNIQTSLLRSLRSSEH